MLKKCLVALALVGSSGAFADVNVPRGKVAVWSNGTAFPVDVQLPSFTDGVLKNDLVEMVNVPADMQSAADGSYSFDPTDDRFAFVHAYYYATQEIAAYNGLMEPLFHKQLSGVKVALSRAKEGTAPSGGGGGMGGIYISYARPAFDISILAHEIGHEVHSLLLGEPIFQVLSFQSPIDFTVFAQQEGVLEGTANLLAALFLGRSKIGEYDLYEGAFDLDNFVRFPDRVPLLKEALRGNEWVSFGSFREFGAVSG